MKRSGEEGGIRSEVQLLIMTGTACPQLEFDAVDTTKDSVFQLQRLLCITESTALVT